MKKVMLKKTKTGIPCLWEEGGAYSNTGNSKIISNAQGKAKKSVYIKNRGQLACAEHALIPVSTGDVVIYASQHRGDFIVDIFKISTMNKEEAELELINRFSEGEWDKPLSENFEAAVQASIDKALDYHCRRPYYVNI